MRGADLTAASLSGQCIDLVSAGCIIWTSATLDVLISTIAGPPEHFSSCRGQDPEIQQSDAAFKIDKLTQLASDSSQRTINIVSVTNQHHR